MLARLCKIKAVWCVATLRLLKSQASQSSPAVGLFLRNFPLAGRVPPPNSDRTRSTTEGT